MKLTKKSMLTGEVHTLALPITEDQLLDFYNRDTLIQNAFPTLSADQREFILTGTTKEEWDEAFAEFVEEIKRIG